MNEGACAALLDALTAIAAHAAGVIGVERGKGDVRRKADGSPVTTADEAAEAAIRKRLSQLEPALPIISEEEPESHRLAVGAGNYFLVDPLDGTREFIAGRDEYAINIALMSEGRPLLGVIAAPALGLVWRGIVGCGAERLTLSAGGECSTPIAIRSRPAPDELVVVISRSHLDPRTQAYVDGFPRTRRIASGSAVKFCRVAEGSADLYPRLAPTRDWDVAAGQAIIEAAGGRVLAPDGRPLTYGTPQLLIPGFIAAGDPSLAMKA